MHRLLSILVIFALGCSTPGPVQAPTPTPTVAPPVVQAPVEQGVYVCPMHDEVRQQGPGQCPKCGMDLVPASEPAPAEAAEDCGCDSKTASDCDKTAEPKAAE